VNGLQRFAPRSLGGQIALLIAAALLIAQAINFAIIFQGRRAVRLQVVVQPVVTRVIDAEERIAGGRFRPGPRARVRLETANPITGSTSREVAVEQALRAELTDAGFRPRSIVTQVQPIASNDPRLTSLPPRQARRLRRAGHELVIAIERPTGNWLVLRSFWPRGDGPLIATLLIQTLILYLALLLPLLWATRRISGPLRSLASAARRFQPGDSEPPIEERGPYDVRALIAAFNQLRGRVGAMLEEKDRMLGAIGHDLRTPLAALRVRIESVEDETDRAKMAETIDEMSKTLDDILSLARLGRSSEPPVATDLGALVEAVVDDFQALGAAVTLAEVPRVRLKLRPALMRRALRNLIDNAVKYGGRAELSVVVRPAEVAIQIVDAGPGIPEDRLEHVFDPFVRIEGSRNRDTGGAGLGLALARAIVREAGGDIGLENRAEGGLEATVLLPRR
jgi:signal transduction histidine kinase